MVFSNNDVLQMRGTPSNQDQSSQGQKVQGNDGIGNGVAGKQGIFDCHVDTHSLHILGTMHVLHTFAAHY